MRSSERAGNRKGSDMWVTGKEIEEAKKHDLLSYLKIADPFELKRFSHDTWCLRSHDSFKISNGLWHWFSRGIGGRSAVDYLIKVKGYSFQMAVKEVNKVMNIEKTQDMRIPEEKKEFRLFVKSPESGKVIRYLTGRGIDCKIVHELIDEGLM